MTEIQYITSTDPIWKYAVVALFVLAVYWVPTVIAAVKRHPEFIKVALINWLVGWTIVGWIVALTWSIEDPQRNGTGS